MAGVVCGQCGHTSEVGAWFCGFCAEPLAPPSATDLTATAEPVALDGAAASAASHEPPADATRSEPEPPVFDDHTEALLDAMSVAVRVDDLVLPPLGEAVPDVWVVVQRTGDHAPSVPLSSDAEVVLALLDKPQSLAALEQSGTLSRRALDLSLMSLREQGLIELSADRVEADAPATDHTSPDVGAADALGDADLFEELSPFDVPAPLGVEGLALDALGLDAAGVDAPARPARPAAIGTVTRRMIPRLSDAASAALLQQTDLADGIARLSVRAKAEQLARAAQRDRRTGSVLSARMNLTLAIALAPDEPAYVRALEELSARSTGTGVGSGATLAEQRYEHARRLEASGHYTQAIAQLRAAIEYEERGAYYHRLGVLLAVHQGERVLGERMVRRATELEPENHHYVRSLARIISRDALRAGDAAAPRRSEAPAAAKRSEAPTARADSRADGRAEPRARPRRGP